MKKYIKKIIIFLFSFLTIGIIAMIIFSPFGNQDGYKYKVLVHSVEINAPVDSVFNYLGNSNNATNWSSYVDHIVPLNSKIAKDGTKGSTRRCFQYASEKGQTWDELTTIVEKNKRRQLTIYNLKNFPIQTDGLATEQIYESLSPTKSRLSFTVFYKDKEPSIIDLLKTYFAGFSMKSIFTKNLSNIKRIVESGR